ncbi:MAG: hypothetical protein KJZ74_11080 [Gemmatimonadales bacterium]|nr:hypothetical protein [Gemmatimonadales bacterium]
MTDRRSPLGALLVPHLRWDPGHGFAYLDALIEESLELGVGGFVVSGGPRDALLALTQELDRRSRHPLLVAAALEAGVGGSFAGATGLPPLAAFGALRDDEAVRRAARLTAREARAHGVNWALAPVCDLDLSNANPFLGSRTFGREAQRAAEWVVEWIDTCQSEGVLACANRFPGTGRAVFDPCVVRGSIEAPAGVLWAEDLLPFRAAVDSGVASVLVSAVGFPALDASRAPAAQSRTLLVQLLRDELHFDGLLLADLGELVPHGDARAEAGEALAALAAGCDLLLAPSDPHAVVEAIESGIESGAVSIDALEASLARREFWADWGRASPGREPTLDDVLWARQVADLVVHPVRGVLPSVGPVVDLVVVDDDAAEGSRRGATRPGALVETLRSLGLDPREGEGPSGEGRGSVVVALFGEPHAGRARAGYQEGTRRRVARAVADARQAQRSAVVLLFGPPRLAEEIPEVANVVCCWSGSAAMQAAAARRLA